MATDQPQVPELRKEIITREWVIVSHGRQRRPSDLAPQPGAAPAPCPFCPGHEGESETLYQMPDGPTGWRVRVVRNKFPALIPGREIAHREIGIFDALSGNGSHEVVIESPEHAPDLWQMPQEQVEAVLEAYRQRYLALKRDPLLQYVLVFRNHGLGAGTSLSHPHSQIIATPMVPHYIEAEFDGIRRYMEYIERCPYCAMLEYELAAGERVVMQNEHIVAFTAFAGRFPYETWLVPRRHEGHFAQTSVDERRDLAAALREVLGRLAGALGSPSYNYALHTGAMGRDHAFHWHLEIFPRTTTPGGFELGSDLYINSTPPEDAAAALRAATIPG